MPAATPDDGTGRRYREIQERLGALRLITEVRDDGVHVRFAPLQRSFRHVPAGEIAAVDVDTYRPGDHGGWHWGVRASAAGERLRQRACPASPDV